MNQVQKDNWRLNMIFFRYKLKEMSVNRFKSPYFTCFLFLLSVNLKAADSVALYSNSNQNLNIGAQIQILEDKTNKLTLEDVVSSKGFRRSKLQIPNLGVSNFTYWVKIMIKNTSDQDHLILEFAYPLLDEVCFFSPSDTGHGYTSVISGDNYHFSSRKYDHQNFIFDILIPKNETRIFYAKVKSVEQMLVPVEVGSVLTIFKENLRKDIIFGIYFGIIIAMFLYNLFIYFTIRDKSYLYYVTYVLFIALTQAALQGYTFKYLWPNNPWLANHSITLFPAIAGFATIGFVRSFLQTRKITPKLDKGLYAIVTIYSLALFSNFVLNDLNLSYNLIDLAATLISLYTYIIAIVIASKGFRSAKYFLLAWTVFLSGVITFVLKNLDILPHDGMTDYTMSIGTTLEVLLFSFALADRINIMKKEKEESQAQVVLALKENEKIIKDQNSMLESKVKIRTKELETSNKNLKDTQSQLVDAEKMASLGQLTAGIAHEINNPLNFVISNVKPLKRDIEDILGLLSKFDTLKNQDDFNNQLAALRAFREQIDSNYLIKEIGALLDGIDEGAKRTAEIIKGLQNFSRLNEDVLKRADIHEGINSSVSLLNFVINSSKIKITKAYGGLSVIDCYPGKLNQVFINILNNAIQAIEERKPEQGEIAIKTYVQNERLKVSIRDNGVGMAEEIKAKVFEPFFTTKEIGKGTGLGLSIAYGIIQKHNGEIKVISESGKGCEFIISLPYR